MEIYGDDDLVRHLEEIDRGTILFARVALGIVFAAFLVSVIAPIALLIIQPTQ